MDCNAANDMGNGTSTGTAWKSIDKVNRSSFSAGDSILFSKGCTWREQLTVPSSGSAGNVITFGVYGSGAKPQINGANLITSWADSAAGGGVANTWSATATTQPQLVVFNGTRGTQVASQAACNGDKKWYWSANTLYTYGTQDPNTTYPSQIEAATRDFAALNSSKDYVILSGLDLRNANLMCVRIQNSNHITLDANTITQCADQGTGINNSTGSSYITYQNNDVSHAGSTGLAAMGDNSIDHVVIENNTVHDNGWNASSTDGYNTYNAAIKVWGNRNNDDVVIQDNEVYNQVDQFADGSGTGIWVDEWGTNAIVRRNKVHDNSAFGIEVEHNDGAAVYYNILYHNGTGGHNWQDQLQIFRVASNNLLYGNIVYNGAAGGISIVGNTATDVMTNNLVKNNISTANAVAQFYAANGGDNTSNGSGNVVTYNAFDAAASNFLRWGGSFYSTYATWEAATGNCGTTGCSHSVQGDPKFVNAAGADFTPQSSSPAINAGADLGSTYQLGLDPRSTFPWSTLNQNGLGSGWEVGAFVFAQQIPPAPPTSLTAIVK